MFCQSILRPVKRTVAICVCSLLSLSFGADAPLRQPRSDSGLWRVNLGDSLSICKRKIPWEQISTKSVRQVLDRSPFHWTLSFLKPEQVAFWSNGRTNANGWPDFIVAEFATKEKTELVDLFEIRLGHMMPVIEGKYQRYLQSIRPGTSIKAVYENLGKPPCQYEIEGREHKLVFTFVGTRGRFYTLVVDPCTGVVTDFRDETI